MIIPHFELILPDDPILTITIADIRPLNLTPAHPRAIARIPSLGRAPFQTQLPQHEAAVVPAAGATVAGDVMACLQVLKRLLETLVRGAEQCEHDLDLGQGDEEPHCDGRVVGELGGVH